MREMHRVYARCHAFCVLFQPLTWLSYTICLFLAFPVSAADDSLSLSILHYKTTDQLNNLTLKPRAERRQVLKNLIWYWEAGDESLLLPKPNISQEERNKALTYARKNLAAVTVEAQRISPILFQSYRNRHLNYLTNILVLTGSQSDSALLLKNHRQHVTKAGDKKLANQIAQLESRLGTLRSGELTKILQGQQPHAEKQYWGLEAAIQLHRRGVELGTELLIMHLNSPPDYLGYRAGAAWALLSKDDPQILTAMRNMLKMIADKHGGWATEEYYIRNTTPAILYLLTYGNDADKSMISHNTLGLTHAKWIAPLLKDPFPVFKLLVDRAYYPGDLGNMISVLTAYPEQVQQETLAALQPLIEQKTKPKNYELSWRQLISPFWPSAETAKRYTTLTKYGPLWLPMPENLKQFFNSWHQDRGASQLYERQFAYIDTPYLSQQIFAHYGQNRWKKVLDSYLLLHSLSTPSTPLNMGMLPNGHNFEPFGLRHKIPEHRWAGVVLGRISYTAQWIDNRLRVGLKIVHTGSATNKEGDPDKNDIDNTFKHYLADDGKALLSSLQLTQNGQKIPLEATNTIQDGFSIYYSDPPIRGFAKTYLDVRLQFFEQKNLIRFALYRGSVAKNMAKSEAETTAALNSLRSAPQPKVSLLTHYAEQLAATGRISTAWEIYQKAIDLSPSDARTWQLAARMYLLRHLYARAVDVLQGAVKRNPKDIILHRELARAQYQARDYTACIATTETILTMEPKNIIETYRKAVCHLLLNHKVQAKTLLAQLPEGFSRQQVGLLRYLANGPSENANQVLTSLKNTLGHDKLGQALINILLGDKLNEQVVPSWGQSHACRHHYYNGYRHLIEGQKEAAKQHFEAAIATHRSTLIEYRLAERTLQTMNNTQ
ncbi:MAG: hypothetical protein HOM11_00555 [Methylococcales bacterium]|jgi:Flp pilus assembly protein TadD|nr:hypothetical protein [Methylococcales bacterium]MBT7444705.1 hypothetical protein [Methylococcales bacterium]